MMSSPHWLMRELYALCANRELCCIADSYKVNMVDLCKKNFMKTNFIDNCLDNLQTV